MYTATPPLRRVSLRPYFLLHGLKTNTVKCCTPHQQRQVLLRNHLTGFRKCCQSVDVRCFPACVSVCGGRRPTLCCALFPLPWHLRTCTPACPVRMAAHCLASPGESSPANCCMRLAGVRPQPTGLLDLPPSPPSAVVQVTPFHT